MQALVEARGFAPDELPALVLAAKTDRAQIVRMSAKALAKLNGWIPNQGK